MGASSTTIVSSLPLTPFCCSHNDSKELWLDRRPDFFDFGTDGRAGNASAVFRLGRVNRVEEEVDDVPAHAVEVGRGRLDVEVVEVELADVDGGIVGTGEAMRSWSMAGGETGVWDVLIRREGVAGSDRTERRVENRSCSVFAFTFFCLPIVDGNVGNSDAAEDAPY
jgi:hypothetical protein